MILLATLLLTTSTPIENAGVLRPFFAKLDSGHPVHIIQIGDSHTAGDAVTQGLRSRMQTRFGHGGRGVMAAGRPYAGFVSHGVTTRQSAGWAVKSLFGPSWQAAGPMLGLTGFTQSSAKAGEWVALASDTVDQGFSRVTLCGLTGPGAGAVQLLAGNDSIRWSFVAPKAGAKCFNHRQTAAAIQASITTLSDQPVNLTSFATFRSGGVTLSNLGVSGAQLLQFGRADNDVLATEIEAYAPDLIILAFGTNEAFSPRLDPDAVAATVRMQAQRLRRFSNAPILLLGAPDALTRNVGGSTCGNGWNQPKYGALVRNEQRQAAQELGLGYWDWAAAMGGACAANRWFTDGLMRPDHVHFTQAGGDRVGALLFAALMSAGARGLKDDRLLQDSL